MTLPEFLEYVNRGEIPLSPPELLRERSLFMSNLDEWESHLAGRDFCVERGMWSIIDLEWTKRFAEWINGRTVLEIMSGRGWLAKALRHHDVDILATDNRSTHSSWTVKFPLLTDVQSLSASRAIKEHGDDFDILLCSWPPMSTEMTKAIRRWGTSKPIIYIGEGSSGCTATESFWRWFDGDMADDFKIPQWDMIHDYVYLGNCRKEPYEDDLLDR